MTKATHDPAIRGKSIRFRWTEGPTKGTTHEHVFHEDGTVEWHDADTPAAASGASQQAKAPEKPDYAAVKVADQVYVVSYLAPSGYTLTVVLNFRDRQLVGFASSAKDWYPIRGTFEVVKP